MEANVRELLSAVNYSDQKFAVFSFAKNLLALTMFIDIFSLLISLQSVQHQIAHLSTQVEVARALTYNAARMKVKEVKHNELYIKQTMFKDTGHYW